MSQQGKRVVAKVREEVLRLHRNGVTVRQISERCGVSKKFVYELVKDNLKASEVPGP